MFRLFLEIIIEKYTENRNGAELTSMDVRSRILLFSNVAGSVQVAASLILLATIISIATRKVTALKTCVVLIFLVNFAGDAVMTAFFIMFRMFLFYYVIVLDIAKTLSFSFLIFVIRPYYKFLENSENVTGEQMIQRC